MFGNREETVNFAENVGYYLLVAIRGDDVYALACRHYPANVHAAGKKFFFRRRFVARRAYFYDRIFRRARKNIGCERRELRHDVAFFFYFRTPIPFGGEFVHRIGRAFY